MKRFLPGRIELGLFAAMAVICAVVVHYSGNRDYAMGLLAMPVFMTAALLGQRRADLAAKAEIEETD